MSQTCSCFDMPIRSRLSAKRWIYPVAVSFLGGRLWSGMAKEVFLGWIAAEHLPVVSQPRRVSFCQLLPLFLLLPFFLMSRSCNLQDLLLKPSNMNILNAPSLQFTPARVLPHKLLRLRHSNIYSSNTPSARFSR